MIPLELNCGVVEIGAVTRADDFAVGGDQAVDTVDVHGLPFGFEYPVFTTTIAPQPTIGKGASVQPRANPVSNIRILTHFSQ